MKNFSSNITIRLEPKCKFKKENTHYYIYGEIFALIKRLYIQTKRRPSMLISGIIQPLLWLILFGALFQNAPVSLLTSNTKYNSFLSPGIIIFTSFTGSINAGLPLMFDREFGFLNRLLISPLKSRDSLLISTVFFIVTITTGQTIFIMLFNTFMYKQNIQDIITITFILIINILITLSIASVSICLAFLLPGHIELLALILIINLPMLFSSTALAPLSFMPYWLQIIASINPLTYAIEIIRYLSNMTNLQNNKFIIQNVWINITFNHSIYLLILITILSITIVKNIISYKFE
uniref:ABC-2 type transporter n=1 Tax=Caulacanthus okamurae TaxID=152008 RepID=A0A6H1U709_9FLOR|nr:ABC-2 type transporter [Caulacanthus okamurae]QIZ74634.1 ABC-2 type transporter [Caulacanthus okamurae]